jgi:two-component system response regulator AgrA
VLKVLICEDHPDYLKKIKNEIRDIIVFEELDMEIVMATKEPYDILSFAKSHEATCLYFFDVDLNSDINGIELAEQIRKHDPRAFIVFLTTHGEMSSLTFKYKVEALDYIVKEDYDYIRIKSCILDAYEKYSKKNSFTKSFNILSKEKILHVDYDKIILFETSETTHKIRLIGYDQQLEFYATMKDVEDKLDERFIRCHRSYIINKDKIQSVDRKKHTVAMENGQDCLISIRGMKHFKKLIHKV